jgi:hypothetical protein
MHAYGQPLGLVLRCPACDASVLRLVQTPRQLRLDVSGIRLLIMSEGSLPA